MLIWQKRQNTAVADQIPSKQMRAQGIHKSLNTLNNTSLTRTKEPGINPLTLE